MTVDEHDRSIIDNAILSYLTLHCVQKQVTHPAKVTYVPRKVQLGEPQNEREKEGLEAVTTTARTILGLVLQDHLHPSQRRSYQK